MRWSYLMKRLRNTRVKTLQDESVYALLPVPGSYDCKRIYLTLLYDAEGNPYFVRDFKAQAAYERRRAAKFGKDVKR